MDENQLIAELEAKSKLANEKIDDLKRRIQLRREEIGKRELITRLESENQALREEIEAVKKQLLALDSSPIVQN
jgi:predicted RecB family nuclease